MTAVAAEVADGFVCAPLTTTRIFTERTLPALVGHGPGFTVCATPLRTRSYGLGCCSAPRRSAPVGRVR
jgi:hypothetical protein